MEDVGIFHGPLVYFKAISFILWPFGIFYGHLVYFSQFGMLHQDKSGIPAVDNEKDPKSSLLRREKRGPWHFQD
jgi:hypothetical protein